MGYTRIASLDQVQENELLSVPTRFGRIALTKKGQDVLAFQDVCTHDDGTLSGGKIRGDEIECPRHGACFNIRSGKATRMPATEDIEVFPVRISGNDVEVDLG